MSKIFALLAVLLIATGVLILAVPGPDAAGGARSLGPSAAAVPSIVVRAREIAEQVNAPLSILFGLVSLYYSRRTYHINRARDEALKAGQSR